MKKLLEKKTQIEREIGRIRARENEENRRRDTRRKIIAGAIFLKLAESESDIKNRMTSALEHLPEKDRKLFHPEGSLPQSSLPWNEQEELGNRK